jgi:hypothetical protein
MQFEQDWTDAKGRSVILKVGNDRSRPWKYPFMESTKFNKADSLIFTTLTTGMY